MKKDRRLEEKTKEKLNERMRKKGKEILIVNIRFIMFLVLTLIILNQFSNIVFAQESDIWFGLTILSLNTTKIEDADTFNIPVPFGDIIFYFISNYSFLFLDCDFINFYFQYQKNSFIYGFEIFYETGILRGFKINSIIFPSIAGFLGFRLPLVKKQWLLLGAAVSAGLGYLYINTDNIEYSDFNFNMKFSHNLYIRIFKQMYLVFTLNNRFYFFFNKNNPLQISSASVWLGLEWKI